MVVRKTSTPRRTASTHSVAVAVATEKYHHQSPPNQPTNGESQCFHETVTLPRTTLPSPELTDFLFEIYFDHSFNANLIHHKATFLREYAENKVSDFVALSIFALATMYSTFFAAEVKFGLTRKQFSTQTEP